MSSDLFAWGSRVERERHTRIKLSVLAYAYEIAGDPLASDAEFDALATTSDPTIQTGRHDQWWVDAFQPYTGSWIHNHPDLAGIARCYNARKAARSSAVRPATDG